MKKKRGIRRATRTALNKFGIIQKNIWRHLQSLLLTRSICHLDVKMYFFLLFYDIFLWRKCKAFRVAFGFDICWVIWSMGDHLKFLISHALVRETNTPLSIFKLIFLFLYSPCVILWWFVWVMMIKISSHDIARPIWQK